MIFGSPDERLVLHMPVKFELCISNPSGAMTRQSLQNMKKNDFGPCLTINISATNRDIARIFRELIRSNILYYVNQIEVLYLLRFWPHEAPKCAEIYVRCVDMQKCRFLTMFGTPYVRQ